jgi:hypothetical protein
MSRGDWGSVVVTLIATGAAYYLRGPRVAAACIILGIIISLILHFTKKTVERAAPTPFSIESNSTQNVGGHAGNITISPIISPIISPVIPTKQPNVTAESEWKQDIPRLDFLLGRVAYLEENTKAIWHESYSDEDPNALIAEFRNTPREAGQRTPTASSVTAGLAFTGRNGQTLHINRATWLDEYTYFADLQPNDTHKLIIALGVLRVRGRTVAFAAMENKNSRDPFRRHFRSGVIGIYHSQQHPLPDTSGVVEVGLIGNNGVTVFHGVFDYSVSDEAMILTPLEGV